MRLIPQYYEESGGTRMVRDLESGGAGGGTGADAHAYERGLRRFFLILDDLGGTFESHTASAKAQRMLDQPLRDLHVVVKNPPAANPRN